MGMWELAGIVCAASMLEAIQFCLIFPPSMSEGNGV